MNEATFAALAAALTVAGLVWTWASFKRRGAPNGLRALGFTLLPAAAWLTGTLEMFAEITTSIADWATGLVFGIFTWAGIGLAGLAVVLFVISGILRDRAIGRGQSAGKPGKQTPATGAAPSGPALGQGSRASSAPAADDDMADIEALLRKRGIS